jgi:hypothetical protein
LLQSAVNIATEHEETVQRMMMRQIVRRTPAERAQRGRETTRKGDSEEGQREELRVQTKRK